VRRRIRPPRSCGTRCAGSPWPSSGSSTRSRSGAQGEPPRIVHKVERFPGRVAVHLRKGGALDPSPLGQHHIRAFSL